MAGGTLYNLLLDRKSIVISILALVAVGVLVFFAGVVVATRWYLPSVPSSERRTVSQGAKSAKSRQAALEPSPVTGSPPQPAAASETPTTTAPAAASAPEPAAAAAAPPESAPQKREVSTEPQAFSIQVGAFLSEYNVESLMTELEERGYQPYVVKVMTPGSQVLYSVRIGKYGTETEAQQAVAEFQKTVGRPAVVRAPGT